MKVLFIVQEDYDSGIATYANNLKDGLLKKGIQVVVDEKYFDKYDIIHIHGKPDPRLLVSKIFNGSKLVVSAHVSSKEFECFVPKHLDFFVEEFLKRGYAVAEKIFIYSKELYNEFKKHTATKDKSIFLPISFNMYRFYNRKNIHKEKFKKMFNLKNKKIVICVGSIQKRKGIIEFLELAKELPQYYFIWIGKTPPQIYLKDKKQINKLIEKKSKNVIFTGNLYDDDLVSAYYSANLFWLPSKSETFGLVNVEAAASGINVLIPNLKVFRQFKKFAIIYKNNPKEKIIDILENPKKYSKKVQIGFNEVNKYDIEKNVDKLIKEYKKLIKSKTKNNYNKLLKNKINKFNFKKIRQL